MNAFFITLSVFFQALPFVLAVVLAVSFCLFCLGAYNSPVIGVAAGVGVYLLSQLGANGALPLGLNLSMADFYFLLLGLVVFIRLATGHLPQNDRISHLWLLMAGVWSLMFLIGLVKFKTAAGVEFRSTFYTLVSLFYLLSFRVDAEQLGKLFKVLYSGGLALASLAIYRWIAYAFGEVGPWFDPHTPLRVLDSSGTAIIAMAMLPGLAMWVGLSNRRTGMMFVAPLLLLVVLILGHRTVWIVSLVGISAAWRLAGHRKKVGRAGLLVPLSVGIALLSALFLLAPKSTVTQEFERSVAETQQKNSTLAWRVDSWKSLVDDWVAGGPAVWPAGKPFGAGNRRFIESQGMETNVGAHSHYVGLLVRGGLLVLAAYLALQLITLHRLLNRPVATPDWLSGETVALFILTNLVYAISYSPDYMLAFFMGLAYLLATQAGPVTPAPSKQTSTPRNPIIRHAPRRLTPLP